MASYKLQVPRCYNDYYSDFDPLCMGVNVGIHDEK